MKILQVCKKFPYPLKDGESLAIHNMAEGLVAGGVELHLFCINTKKHFFDPSKLPDTANPYASITLVPLDTKVTLLGAFLNLFSGRSYHIQRFWSPRVARALEKLLEQEKFDVIQLEGIHLMPYKKRIEQFSDALLVLRAHNLEHQIWERITANTKTGPKKWYLSYLTKKLKKFEEFAIRQTSFLVPISSLDLGHFNSMGFRGQFCLCPIGIDPNKYLPETQAFRHFAVFSLGSMDWLPNLEGIDWFRKEVWPDFHRKFPDATLHIAGRNMPESWLSDRDSGIEIHGEVPDAVSFMNKYPVMIVPLFSGSGMRAKIIEAMALGRTVVTTTVGLEGIPGEDGRSVCLADSREGFVRQLSDLALDKAKMEAIGKAGRKLVSEYFQSSAIAQKLLESYCLWLAKRREEQLTNTQNG